MKTMQRFASTGVLCWAVTAACTAQFGLDWARLELHLDARTLTTQGTPANTELYSWAFRLQTDVAREWRTEVYGVRKYDEFLFHEAHLSRQSGSNRIQIGLVRLPFGIYDHQETYATGLIDYPAPRVDYAFNSVDWGVSGIKWQGHRENWQWELAAFEGSGSGTWNNQDHVGGAAVRLQAYWKDLIVGISRWDGYYNRPVMGRTRHNVHVNGLDFRFTRPHLIVRGEYLFGLVGEKTRGWYIDFYYRLPKYERWTFVARLEELKPRPNVAAGEQITLGVRYVMPENWVFAVNWRRNDGFPNRWFSWTQPSGKGGEWLFQVYRKMVF